MKENDDFLGRWADNKLSEEEESAFRKTKDFEIYKKIWAEASLMTVTAYNEERHFRRLKNQTEGGKRQAIIRRLYISVAAAAIGLFCVYQLALTPRSVSSDVGEIVDHRYSDAVTIKMNAQSQITYAAQILKKDPTLSLSGEAYFEVEKGTNFSVTTEYGAINVLGTKFNVFAREDFFEVSCFEGQVQVTGVEQMTLGPGQVYRQINEQREHEQIDMDVAPDWLNKESYFYNAPVGIVFKELEIQYGITIEGNVPHDSTRLTVGFPNNNAPLALDLVFKSLQKSYKKRSEKVVLVY